MKTLDPATTEVFEQLADAYTRALRDGESPSIDEVAEAHPLLAERIRLLFPMLALMEQGPSASQELPKFGDRLPDQPLERLGDFRIEREIGRGGMGIVYQAVQESLGRQVALKLLPQNSLDGRSAERFHQEARFAAMLHHTNIVPVYGVGQHEGYAYFVMQYIEGQGLDRVLVELENLRSGARPLPLDSATPGNLSASAANLLADAAMPVRPVGDELRDTGTLRRDNTNPDFLKRSGSGESGLHQTGHHYWINVARVGCQIASALAHAHSQKILHRDIKPSNLILDEAGSVWVTDFGLARLYENDRLTRTGEVVGTLRYMPPEQMSGQSDLRGDVYGLGLTLYEMLVLRPAFDETDHRRLIAEVSECQPPPPRRLDPRIPRDLETIVLKCINREPDKRYQSAADLERDLNRFIAGEPIAARRISTTERLVKWARRRPAVAALAVLAAVLAIVGVGGVTWKWREANLNLLESQKQSAARGFYFSKSLDAVDQMLARTGSELLASVPGMGEVRRQLLTDALVFYTELLQDSEDDPTLRREFGRIQKQVAYIHHRLGDQEQALAAYVRSAETFDQLRLQFPEDPLNFLDYAVARNGHAQILHQIGRSPDSELELREVIQLLEDQPIPDGEGDQKKIHAYWLQVRAESHAALAAAVQSTRGNNPAMEQMEESLELFAQIPEDYSKADSVLEFQARVAGQLAQKLESVNQVQRSQQLRDRAIAIFEELLQTDPESPEFRNSIANIRQARSGTLARQGKLAEAATDLANEIADRRELIRDFPNVPALRQDFARSLAICGSVLHDIGNFDEGQALMQESVTVATELVQQFPDVVGYQLELAYASQTMGTTAQQAGGDENLEMSRACYHSAYDVYQRIVQLAPNNPQYEYELGLAARNWSVACLNLGDDPGRGIELLNEAISIFSKLSAAEPENVDYLYQLAFTQINLARLQGSVDVAAASETLLHACDSLEQLIAMQPQEPRYRLQLTRALDERSQLHARLGELDQWEDALRQAHVVMRGVVEDFGSGSRLIQFLTISQNHLAHCIKTRGQVEEAEQLFQAALDLRKSFVDADPGNVQMTRQMASAHGNLAWSMAYWREPANRDLDVALHHATIATELDPDAAEHWTCLAHIRYRQGDYAAVDEVAARCSSVNESDQMARLAVQAMAFWQLDRHQDARDCLAAAEALGNGEFLRDNFHARLVSRQSWQLLDEARDLLDP